MIGQIEDLTREDYELIRRLVYARSGINLGDHKMQLVRARLGRRLRQGGFASFREYYRRVEQDPTGEELCRLLDAISTNTTHLFRESRHFDVLRDVAARWSEDPARKRHPPALRIWSAGCSSGEEPYSIAMVAHDVLRNHPGIDLKILATDLSVRMLSRARLGLFEGQRIEPVPPGLRSRYFRPVQNDGQAYWQVIPELRQTITFARFNLMTPTYPFRHGFDVIFCRNVMIYFDRPTQQEVVHKLVGQLHRGGYLMIGHSESLNGMAHPLSFVEPTVYRKD